MPPDAREPPRGRPPLLPVARAFFHRGLQEALSYRAAFGLRLFAAAFTLAAFYFLARFINMGHSPLLARYGGDYLSFGLVGMVLLTLQHTAVSAYPQSIRAAQVAGTLEAMLATPAPAWLVLVCSPLYRFASAFVWAAIYLLAVFAGASPGELGPSLAGLALFCAVMVPAGLVFFGWTLGRTRRDGSLTHF